MATLIKGITELFIKTPLSWCEENLYDEGHMKREATNSIATISPIL